MSAVPQAGLPHPRRFLLVCSQNRLRRLTAEDMSKTDARCRVKSAGTDAGSRVRVTEGMIGWADTIFAMEKKPVEILREKFRDRLVGKRLVCLHIPDEYAHMDPALVLELSRRVAPGLEDL